MLKRLTALICAMVMMLCVSCQVFATTVPYTEGPRSYTIDFNDYTKLENGRIDENGYLVLSAGGCVEYNFYLPFESSSMIFECYADENVKVRYDVGEGEKNATLSYGSTNIRSSFSKGGKRKGDCTTKLSCDKEMTIKEIVYTKKPKDVDIASNQVVADYTKYKGIDLTPLQDAVRSAVIIHSDSPMLMMKGMKKYIDYDNISQKPMIKDGSLCLPIRAFAEAVGYYYEDLPDKDYALLRSDSAEFVLKDGKVYQKSGGTGYEPIQNVIFRENGITWVTVRYLAEMASKKVIYRDGYTFIEESKNLVDSVTETELFDELKAIFESFMQPKSGSTYYVAKNGDDNNDGSEAAPFKTISRAGDIAQAGDTVIIGEGIYEETLVPKNSGTPSNPIIYKAKDGEDVTISAFEWVDIKPTQDEDGLYVYDMGYTLGDGRNQIFYNDEVLVEARYPNKNTSPCPFPDELNLSPLWPTRGNIIATADKTGAISRTDLNQEDDYWKGGTLVSLNGGGWSLGTAKITHSTKGRLDIGEKTINWWFAGEDSRFDYAYITGCKNAIDMPGEWYWDEDGKLYIMLPEGETPETFKFMAKKRQVTVDIADKNYTQLVGINTYGGGMKLNHSEMCVINGGEHRYISHYIFSYDQHYSFIDSDSFIDKNGAPLRGEMGFMVGGSDNAVVNTKIAYSAAAGIYMTGLNSYVANNDVEECGYMSSYVCGIYIVPNFAEDDWSKPRGGHQIIYNTASKSGRAVIGIAACDSYKTTDSGMWPFLAMDIGYNEFSDGSICARDTGTVYFHGATVGDDRAFTDFHHNIIYNPWVAVGHGDNVYWDNWIHNANMFDCIAFANNSEEFNLTNDYFIQNTFGGSNARVENWDNVALGRCDKTVDTLTAEDYPKGELFRVGVNSQNYTKNYESIDLTPEVSYKASKAEKSSNVTVAGDFVDLNKNGEWICFKDVEFSGDNNSIEFAYRGDYRSTGDKVEVIVGDTMATGYSSEHTLTIPSYKNTEVYTQRVIIPNGEGKKNVWIKASTYKSAQIGAVKTICASPEEISSVMYAKTMAVDCSEKGNGVGTKTEAGYNIVYNTQNTGAYVGYKGVEIPTDVNAIAISGSSGQSSNNQKIEIRLGSATGTVIGEVIINDEDDNWSTYNENVGKLYQTLPKGTYDIYFTFEKNKSTNIWYFGFQNRLAETEVTE